MESHKHLEFKTAAMILIMIIAGPLGNVLLGKGMKSVGAFSAWPLTELSHTLLRILSTGTIWFGIASLITFFVANILVLSWADYSYVLPASAVSYVVVGLIGSVALGEHVPVERWIGIAFICAGAVLVGRTLPVAERKVLS